MNAETATRPEAPPFRCRHHPDREAVARCPQCRRFFCRECVSEHGGRMLCAACLQAGVTQGPRDRSAPWVGAMRLLAAATGFLVIWLTLMAFGLRLASLPDATHQQTLWREDPPDAPPP